MLTLPSSLLIHLCTRPVDMRKSFDGLSLLTREVLREDPLNGYLFVFFNRTRDMVRVLWWHSGGFCLFSKRLEKGSFCLPRALPEDTGSVTLEAVKLTLLLEGIDLKASVRRPRWQPPPLQLGAAGVLEALCAGVFIVNSFR